MLKKLVLVSASAAALLLGSGVAQADPAAPAGPAPDPNGPKCAINNGGDDGNKFQYVPCGWAYGDNRGWYQTS
jgi:hypothetical protein